MNKNKVETDVRVDVEAAWRRMEERIGQEAPAAVWLEPSRREEEASRRSPEARPARAEPAADGTAAPEAGRTEGGKRRRPWRARMAAAAAACLAFYLLTGTVLGDRVMAAMLQTFRIQQIAGVGIGAGDLDRLQAALEEGAGGTTSIDLARYGDVRVAGGGKTRAVTAEEAERLTGMTVRMLPNGSAGESAKVEYTPSTELTLTLHTGPINRLLNRLGGTTPLPAAADGKPIVIDIPATVKVTAASGDAEKYLLQAKVPTIAVPDGVDTERVREAVLSLPVLPDSVRRQLSAIQDWQHTLPVPFPKESGKELTVNGRRAVMVTGNGEKPMRALTWAEEGRIFLLVGNAAGYPTETSILKEAGELVR